MAGEWEIGTFTRNECKKEGKKKKKPLGEDWSSGAFSSSKSRSMPMSRESSLGDRMSLLFKVHSCHGHFDVFVIFFFVGEQPEIFLNTKRTESQQCEAFVNVC